MGRGVVEVVGRRLVKLHDYYLPKTKIFDVIVTSYEDEWYFFGINGKRRPIAIYW